MTCPTAELVQTFHAATREELPPPGGGRTPERFARLFDIAAEDLEAARLAEAHHDAIAIARELDAELRPGASYGVWAAAGDDPLVATPRGRGWHLTGVVPWCTGIGIVDRALVSAQTPDGPLLVDIEVASGRGVDSAAPWLSPAFASTDTRTLRFDLEAGERDVIGGVGAYLTRSGFWHGAVGVSACWAGGLSGLLRAHVARWRRDEPHALAHLGAAHAWSSAAFDVLVAAAREIDATPLDQRAAEARARRVRHVVERACTMAIDDLAVGAGPEPLAFDDAILRRTQQLQLYVRQCHGERDLEPLGRYVIATR